MLAIMITVICFSSCQETLTDATVAEIEKEINEISETTMNYFNEGDLDAAYSNFSDDFTAMLLGKITVTPEKWDQFKTNATEGYATNAPVHYKITESRVEVLATTVVNYHFTYNHGVDLGDDISYESSVGCTWTYLLEDGAWKIRNAHISNPMEKFRAGESDKVFLAFLDVKKDMKEEFERITHEVIFDKASETDQRDEFLITKTRVLHPVKDNEDGTATYLIILDPFIEGEYDFTTGSMLKKIYGEEEGQKLSDQFEETMAGPQKSYLMTQSRH